MKKSLFIVVLAIAMVMALGATPAFAKYAGFNSAQQYVTWGSVGGTSTVALNLASQNPDAALMAFGPHNGYATTTIKCAVCHSVHRGTTKLLNSGSSCAYCHSPAAEGGGAVAPVLISWYSGSAAPAGAGPHSTCASTYCHGGPHGVGASTYAGPSSKLLTHAGDANLDALALANGVPTTEFATYSAKTRALATGAVCGRTGCHNNSLFGVVSAGATQTLAAPAATVTAHRVIASASTTWNVDASFPTGVTGTIAYAPVDYCNSCHDLKDDNNGGKKAFPHAITGVVDAAAGADGTWRPAVWLTAGAYSGDTSRAAVGTYNQYAITARGSSANADQAAISAAAGSSILDGTCLKCHRGSATTGVGMTGGF